MSVLLPTRRVEKPWGRTALPAPFVAPADGQRIGEIWFEPTARTEPLLAKILFTSERLSVQVHPSDKTSPSGRGKDECWLVLDAEPDAQLGIGFDRDVTPEQIAAAAQDGSIVDLLAWHRVQQGDFVSLPSGTVHAIGAGLTLAEIQQNSDITYRLYDYGRPRELHLAQGLAVARTGPHPRECWGRLDEARSMLLLDGPKFRLAHLAAGAALPDAAALTGPLLVLTLAPGVMVCGEDVPPGSAAECAGLGDVSLSGAGRCLVAASVTPR